MRIERRGIFGLALLSLVPGWWGAAKARPHSYANMTELRAVVMAAFKKQRGVSSVTADPHDPAKFRVAIGKETATADITNIFGYINAYPEEDSEKIIANFVSSLTRPQRKVEESNLVAVIRTKEYIDQLLASGLKVLHEPAGADLMTLYMADLPDSMSPVMTNDLPGRSLADIRKLALGNVRKWLPKVVADGQLGDGVLYFVEDDTMLSTSLILLEDFWKSVARRFPEDVLIALPRKDQLFVFDDNPNARAGARRLIDETISEGFNLLSSGLYARRGGKIEAVSG